MILEISVVPKSGRFRISAKEGKIKVYLKSPAEENKANLEIIKEFEKLFGKPVRIISGIKSKKKKIELPVTEDEWNDFVSGI